MKDYYKILGVLPSAEDIVIKAAYKALAQRYHPDRYQGSVEEAHSKMAELNEAYATLGDPEKRREYDSQRRDSDGFDEESTQSSADEINAEVKTDWEFACEYFPDLSAIFSRLAQTAHRLAITFELYILISKRFDERVEIANEMEVRFLKSYFGDNPSVIAFAKALIERGNRKALKELNRAVDVLGSNVNPNLIISKIVSKYDYRTVPKSFTAEDRINAEGQWLNFKRAIYEGRVDDVRLMLNKHPALTVIGDSGTGNSSVHVAVLERQPEVLRALIMLGADPNQLNNFGNSGLSFAKDNKHNNELKVLNECGYF